MLRLKRVAFAASLSLALAAAGGITARAQDHHDDHRPGGGLHGHAGPGFRPGFRGGFHGHDFAHFTPAEHALWLGGSWHHAWRDGRFGWWWAVGPAWYFYPAPIYPYPDYVAEVYDAPALTGPPAAVAPAGGAPGYWYYCAPTGAYYPYVQSCAVPWTPVAPTPPQTPPQ